MAPHPASPALASFHGAHRARHSFGTPPPEIGHVLSAYCSLEHEEEGPPMTRRIPLAIGTALLAALALGGILTATTALPMLIVMWLAFLVGLVGAVYAWFGTASHAITTFVGDNGAARLTRNGPEGKIRTESFRFADASTLEKTHSNWLEGERYLFENVEQEEISFTWRDAQGRILFAVSGTNYHRTAVSEPMSAYLFGRAVEERWTDHLMDNVARDDENETLLACFPLKGIDGWIGLEEDHLVYRLPRGKGSIPWSDVAELYFEERDFVIQLKDGRTTPQGGSQLTIHFLHFPNELYYHRLCESLTGLKGALHPSAHRDPRLIHDAQTDLAGSLLFRDRLEVEIARTIRNAKEGKSLAALVVKFTNLPFINHAAASPGGTDAVREIGLRMAGMMRGSDSAARLSGTEFAALLPDFDPQAAEPILEKFREILSRSIDLAPGGAPPRLALGMALYPNDAETPADLIKMARKNACRERFDV